MARNDGGRHTHRYDGDLVVFLIGMRINRPWRVDQWFPVFIAMPRMLTELMKEPGSGLMGFRLTFGSGGPLVVQYWNSPEKLYAYATDSSSQHRPAWAAFNRRARKSPGNVGIWHETYVVARAESMYSGMPAAGLAKATQVVDVNARTDHGPDRLAQGATAA